MATTSSIETLQNFFISFIKSCINCSGADAPDVKPIVFDLTIKWKKNPLEKGEDQEKIH